MIGVIVFVSTSLFEILIVGNLNRTTGILQMLLEKLNNSYRCQCLTTLEWSYDCTPAAISKKLADNLEWVLPPCPNRECKLR